MKWRCGRYVDIEHTSQGFFFHLKVTTREIIINNKYNIVTRREERCEAKRNTKR